MPDMDKKKNGFISIETAIAMIFPIGGLLFLNSNDDPNELYQGTSWTKLDGGRTIISTGTYSDSSGSYTYNLGDTGGEAKHILSVEELPAHTHGINATGSSDSDNNNQINNYHQTIPAWGATRVNQTLSVGSNTPHENRPPYIAINIWQRIT